MNRFAALIDRLEAARDEETAARTLADHLARTEDPDRGLALGLMLGATPVLRAGRSVLQALAARLDPQLLAISKETTGDLGEAIALMWPGPPEGTGARLADIVPKLALAPREPAAYAAVLAGLFDRLGPAERVALVRLARGQLAGALTARAVQAALAQLGGVALADVEAVWHADAPPYPALFAWLAGKAHRPPPARVAPFRALAPVMAHAEAAHARLDPASLAVDRAWDGLRVLAISEGGTRRLYTRRGEDVGARFPEILAALALEGAIEGVILARDAEGRLSRAALDRRIAGARRPRANEPPAELMAHDLLAHAGEDLTGLSLRARRVRLAEATDALAADRVAHVPPAALTDWAALEALRTEARAAGAAGVVLKPWDAAYGARWIEARCAARSARLVLLYLESGLDGLTATLGAWSGGGLVPVAHAALPDPETAAAIEDYVADRRVDRFGPVEQVRADADQGLVVEAVFDAVEAAPRRKAGLVLRGARVAALHPDLAPGAAVNVAELEALLV